MNSITQPVSKTFHTMQLVFSALAALMFWGVAALTFVFAIISLALPNAETESGFLLLLVSFVMVALGAIMLPGVVFAIQSLRGKDTSHLRFRFSWYYWLIVPVWVGLVFAGSAASDTEGFIRYVFPPIHVLAVMIPIVVIIGLAIRNLQFRSPQRASGLIATGLMGGSFLSMIIEVVAMLALLVLGILAILFNPELQAKVLLFANQLSITLNDPETAQQILLPVLQNPWVFLGMLLFFSGLVPLLEEACKPVGFWFLTGRDWTPRDGFIGGLMSGAGFALIESLFASAQATGEDWLFLIITRGGTAIMHMLASGMVGWGLASAWQQRKYFKLIGGYLLAATLHGTWNAIAIIMGISQMGTPPQGSWLHIAGAVAPYLLGILTAGGLVAIILINRSFQKAVLMAQIAAG